MVYKISLVSTHGTGKTTLASGIEHVLKKRGVETRHIPEMATEAIECGLPINIQTTLEAQLWILHQQFAAELKYSGRREMPPHYQVIICDRSIDNYCYLERNVGFNQHALDMVLGHVRQFPYDSMYLLPIIKNSVPLGNGVREIDPSYQVEMDNRIRAFLKRYEIPFIELPLPKKEDDREWVQYILNKTLEDLSVK